MNTNNLLFLLFTLLVYQANSQNTLDLFSLDGLTIASNSSDDIGEVHRTTTFYIKDTTINNKKYLEYHNKNCASSFIRVESYKVYQRNLLWDEEENFII